MDQFVDMCIMCGCDYVNNIRGIGPVRALQLIQKHGTIDVGLLPGYDYRGLLHEVVVGWVTMEVCMWVIITVCLPCLCLLGLNP